MALVDCAANGRGIGCAREVHYQQGDPLETCCHEAVLPTPPPKSERVQPLDAARLATLQVVTWL
jgi:hypothetical protein